MTRGSEQYQTTEERKAFLQGQAEILDLIWKRKKVCQKCISGELLGILEERKFSVDHDLEQKLF